MVSEQRSLIFAAAILVAWVTLILVTHAGPRSPYTYAAQAAGIAGQPVTRDVNPDAVSVLPVTRFFYDGAISNFGAAHNLRLPLHSFVTSIVSAFVRPYMAANYVTNWLFMILLIAAALHAGVMFQLRPWAMLLALATVFALPAFTGYLGQPMHYIVGPVINYLIILAAMTLPEEDLRNPLLTGLMTAVMTLNYDWFVFGAALGAYLIFVVRFRTVRDALLYIVVALAPLVLWQRLIDAFTSGEASYAISSKFFGSITASWAWVVRRFWDQPLFPFTVTHIGAHIGVHEVLAMVWWPLLACCLIVLWKGERASSPPREAGWKPAPLWLLVAFFVAEQLLTAAFDPENNPRRALPVVLAFAIAWVWVVSEQRGRKWTAVFIALFALTAFLAFADTLFKSPWMVTAYMGETIREEPKWILQFQDHRIEISDQRAPEQAAVRQSFPRAVPGNASWLFAVAQGYAGFFMLVFFWILARARLLPRYAPHVFAAIWLASAVRYLW